MQTRKNAFTLIELLVVIAIIGLLAALLFPAVSSAMQRSKRTYCLNNLKQIGLACAQYANDAKGFWPPGKTITGKTMKDVVQSLADATLITDAKIWVCPSDKFDEGGSVAVATSLSNTFNSVGNCSYAYLLGLGDRSGLPPGFTPACADESNQSDRGGAPGALQDMTKDDNHGDRFRNVLYFDNHAATLPSGLAVETYRGAPSAGDTAWTTTQWTD